ncbi:MAG TPA: sigma 54-interacting transcriptional regulator, partial [Thermoplasmata archaeon]|nr:sigma 54-interacting transcriptional regulator [Thermoplasmata archaeon]
MTTKQTDTPSEQNEQNVEELPPIDVWIQNIKFTTTEDIKVPENLLDQVIGQDQTVAIVKKAAEQKRHVMLIGDPGTGKSMVARAMTEFLPKGELEDIIVYPNNEDTNTPTIRVVPAGKAHEIIRMQREEA